MGREAGNQRGQELEEGEFFFNTVPYFAKGKAQYRGGGRGGQEWGSAQYGKQEVQPHLSLLVILLLTLYYENQLLASRL